MARCKHPFPCILELGTYSTVYVRPSPEPSVWTHDFVDCSYTGRVHVTCPDCGLDRSYSANRDNWPQWLQQAWDKITGVEVE